VGKCGLESSGSGRGLVMGSCKHGNEPLGSITGSEFITSWETINFSRTLLHGVS